MGISELSWNVIAIFGGIQAVITGLLGFLGKLWLGRTLQEEKAKIEAAAQKSVYMHKVQYDVEFKIYSELWKELCIVQDLMGDMKIHEEESSRLEKLNKYETAVKRLESLLKINRPFYSASIAKHLGDMVDLTKKETERREEVEKKDTHRITGEMFDNYVEMGKATYKICESIRNRLAGKPLNE